MTARPKHFPPASAAPRRSAKVATLTALVLSVPFTGIFTGTAYADADAGPGAAMNKITICRATGSATDPFVVMTPAKSSVIEGRAANQDQDDIIPPFSYDDHGIEATFDGQNATPANLALLAAGDCPAPVPAEPPVVAAPPAVVVVPPVTTDSGNANENEKVTICHATGSATDPFVVMTPSKNGVLNGHVGVDLQEGEDIIPSFTYDDHGTTTTFPGQNATPANLALLAAGDCPVPVPAVPTAVVVVPPPAVVIPPATSAAGAVVRRPTSPVVAPVTPVVTPARVRPITKARVGTVAQAFGSGVTVVAPAAAVAGPTSLPRTGADTGLLTQVALVLLVTGAGALVVGRRREGLAAA